MPGWNARTPPGVRRCECVLRREWWARLSPQMTQGCCGMACCQQGGPVLVTASRAELQQLRTLAAYEGWPCPRCGQPIAAHWRGFECVDQRTRALRAKKRSGR